VSSRTLALQIELLANWGGVHIRTYGPPRMCRPLFAAPRCASMAGALVGRGSTLSAVPSKSRVDPKLIAAVRVRRQALAAVLVCGICCVSPQAKQKVVK
jgi:hypothetical protein